MRKSNLLKSMPRTKRGWIIYALSALVFCWLVKLGYLETIRYMEHERTEGVVDRGEFVENTEDEIKDTLNCMSANLRYDYALHLMKKYFPSDRNLFDAEAPRKVELLERMKSGEITVGELKEFHQDAFWYIAKDKGNFIPAYCSDQDCFAWSVFSPQDERSILTLRTGYMIWSLNPDQLYHSYNQQDWGQELSRLRDREVRRDDILKRADAEVARLKVKHLGSHADLEKMRSDLVKQMVCDELYEAPL